VVGKDAGGNEVIYIGAANGKFVAINAEDSSEKWSLFFGGLAGGIISSPAVSENGHIFFITNSEPAVGRPSSFLHKADTFGNHRWSYEFPDDGITSSSPKVLRMGDNTLIFVYVLVRTKNFQGELFVFRDGENQPELLDRKALGFCPTEITGDPGYLDFPKKLWDLLTDLPVVEFDTSAPPLSDTFLQPTIAITTEGRQRPLIALADNFCNLGAYEWDGTTLTVLWRHEHDGQKHSSPVITPSGLMVFGRKDGSVLAYDVDSGGKVWEYKADEPVFATPAAPPGQFIFVVSRGHVHVVHAADGTLIHDGDFPRKLAVSPTYASPAVTANLVHVALLTEMLTLSYDLKIRAHDPSFHGNGLSSIAIGGDGSVFAVQSGGTVVKYPGID
jgi:outer membrane protein assembly factor BamB